MEYALIGFTGCFIVILIIGKKWLFIGRGKTPREAKREVEDQSGTNSKHWKRIN